MTRYEYIQEEVQSLMVQSTGHELEGDINPLIERHLLAKLNTIFDRARVSSLTKAEVEQIAAEDDSVREEGFRICRKIVANSHIVSF